MPSWCFIFQNQGRFSGVNWLVWLSKASWAECNNWLLWFWNGWWRKLLVRTYEFCWSRGRFPYFNWRERNRMHGALHSPWASGSEYIELIRNGAHVVVSNRCQWRNLTWMDFSAWLTVGLHYWVWRLTIINGEFGSQEIRPVQSFTLSCM